MLRAYGAEVVITPTAVDARLARELLLRLRPPRRGDPRRLQARPVLEPGEPGGALRDDRPRDLGADRAARSTRSSISVGTGGTISGDRPLLQGAEARGADRRRRPRGLGLHRGRRASAAPVPRRGDRQGHVAGDDRPGGRRRVGARLRPRLVPRPRGGSRARRGCSSAARAGRRPGRRSRSRSGSARSATILMTLPDGGPLVPLEVLRRQLDARARLHRAACAGPERSTRCSASKRRRGAAPCRSSSTIDVAQEGRRRDRPDAALRDLAAPGRPRTAGGGARPTSIGSLQERSLLDRVFRNPDALERGRRGRDAAAARRRSTRRASLDEVFAELTGPGGAVVVARAGKPVAILTRSDLLEFLAAQRTQVEA